MRGRGVRTRLAQRRRRWRRRTGYRGQLHASPWRWSFDRETGLLWAGDVGASDWEEIDIIVAGGNYGWRCYEPNVPFNLDGCAGPEDFTFPVADYPHALGIAVVGGYAIAATPRPRCAASICMATTAPGSSGA